jgi:hypothetical protein
MSSLIEKCDYKQDQLVEVKIPLNLHYYSDSRGYEAFDGEVEINKVLHRYVMKKVYNDTLFLLCLPDLEKTKLSVASINYIGAAHEDGKSSNNPLKSSGKKIAIADEYQLINSNPENRNAAADRPLKYNLFKNSHFLNHDPVVPGQPPELC